LNGPAQPDASQYLRCFAPAAGGALVPRDNNLLEFRRRHRLEKPLPPRRSAKRCRKIGEPSNHYWGVWRLPYGFVTWMIVTGVLPLVALGIAALAGWPPERLWMEVFYVKG
jgi:hypothetical protein